MNYSDHKISIIVPVYNMEQYVTRCLSSIKRQTHTNFEAIIVNDGSTDNSLNLCNEFALKDSRFRIISQQNQGLSAARNTGLELAKNQYVTFIDSDDWVHPQFLELLLNVLLESEADISMCHHQITMEYNEDYEQIFDTSFHYISAIDTFHNLMVGDESPHVVWNKLYHRSIIGTLRFRKVTCEDTDFNYAIYAKNPKIVGFNAQLYYYFSRPGSLSQQNHNAFTILGIASYFDSYSTYLRDKIPPEIEKTFLWRYFLRLISRRTIYSGSEQENLCNETFKAIVNKHYPDFKRHLPWIKRTLWKICWDSPRLCQTLIKCGSIITLIKK